MPIEALPQATVRAIGSTSVISDPCSIVKELLDNSLDASASSIAVEISQNTLDVIQVKDNGHGIRPEDHAFVCKRTFTSKIHTIDDLQGLGGKYLGFRGEALASAAEMSSSITVTTRIEAELTGSSIKYGRNGELLSTQRAPHPVGTTVRICDFLKHIPVRRQTALKNTAKTLARVRKLVQTYAMSQPSKRLSLKVLKAKSESNNWVYAPGQNATLMDAALKVVGNHVASCCMAKVWPSEGDSVNGEQSRRDASGYKLIALLSKADSDLPKVNNAEQYFSVDGRPLSTARGIGRDITKLYKKYLRAATSDGRIPTPFAEPFLCLHINCPQGTYDVNVEPAKDDILFENPHLILLLVEDLFRDAYGELADSNEGEQTSTKRREKTASKDGFELLLARKSPDPTPRHQHKEKGMTSASAITSAPVFRSPATANSRRGNVHDDGENHEVALAQSETEARDVESLNPGVLARMNIPNRQPPKSNSARRENRCFSITTTRREPLEPRRNSRGSHQEHTESSALNNFEFTASIATSPSVSRYSPPSFQAPAHSSTTSVPGSAKRTAREQDRERYGNGAIDTWFQKTVRPTPQNSIEAGAEPERTEPSLAQLTEQRFGSQERESSNSSPSAQGFTPVGARSGDIFGSSSGNQSDFPSRCLLQGADHRRQGLPTPQESPCRQQELPVSLNTSGLNDALEFERRKREVIQRNRERMKARFELPSADSPHRSRYLAAKAALSSDCHSAAESQGISASEKNAPTSRLGHDDPRTYLMRQQSAQQENGQPKHGMKLQRTHTKKLPLEKIPEGHDLHDISVTIPGNSFIVSDSLTRILRADLYTQSGTGFHAFLTPDSENAFQLWRSRLSALINNMYTAKGGSQAPNLQFDFSAITRHFDSFEAGTPNP